MKPYLWIIQFQGDSLLKRKENSSRGSYRRLWAHLCCHTKSAASLRNINLIPFWLRTARVLVLVKEFPYVLGSSNPWSNAVLMEPFSTSVFKVLIWIFATTTKICTKHCSTKTHVYGFCTMLTPSYSLEPHICSKGWVSAPRLSAIHFQG